MNPVLVVEDNAETRRWLCACVDEAISGGEIVSVGDVAAAQEAIAAHRFSLAVVDLGLPDGSGIDIIRALDPSNSGIPVLVATMYDDDKHLFDALRSGARGYILKDQDRDKVVSYLQGLSTGEVALSNQMAAKLVDHFNARGRDADDGLLAPREKDVLGAIAKGFSVADTAQMLGLSINTVKSYVKTIYGKLGVSSRAEATAEAIRRGLLDID